MSGKLYKELVSMIASREEVTRDRRQILLLKTFYLCFKFFCAYMIETKIFLVVLGG
jgi:hypothetical protein